jgi:uncharacterized protein (DUF305 family)
MSEKKSLTAVLILLAEIIIAVLCGIVVTANTVIPTNLSSPFTWCRSGFRTQDWAELMTDMDAMHAAMGTVEWSGDSDVDFVKLMLPHHQGAIDMAKTQLLHGKDPQMRRLAQEIIIDQESEIQLMQLWLKQRDALTSEK